MMKIPPSEDRHSSLPVSTAHQYQAALKLRGKRRWPSYHLYALHLPLSYKSISFNLLGNCRLAISQFKKRLGLR